MRKIKPECVTAKDRHGLVILQNVSPQGLVKANRFLLLLATSLMIVVFILGFLLVPDEDIVGTLKATNKPIEINSALQNPVLSGEINLLKGQLVGLISGSIDNKLRALEVSVRKGSTTDALGTIQDLKNDVTVLQSYSSSKNSTATGPENQALLQEVSHLKRLIYLTLTSCGLMIVAVAGFLVRKHFYLDNQHNRKNTKFLGR